MIMSNNTTTDTTTVIGEYILKLNEIAKEYGGSITRTNAGDRISYDSKNFSISFAEGEETKLRTSAGMQEVNKLFMQEYKELKSLAHNIYLWQHFYYTLPL